MGVETKPALALRELYVNVIKGDWTSGYVAIGEKTTSQGLASENDLFVKGKLEVDGIAYFDGLITSNAGITLATGQDIAQNVALSGGIRMRNSGQTPDCPTFFTGTLANHWLMIETADVNFDFAHAQSTNPTLFIHSANQATDEWISITHDQTDGVIDCGTGTLNLGATGNVNFAGATFTGTGDTATNGYVTMEVAGAAVKFATVA